MHRHRRALTRITCARHESAVYPLDYGYLSGTSGGDGNEIDAWRGSDTEALLDAVVCTCDPMRRASEVKLLIGCAEEEKVTVCQVHIPYKVGDIMIRRNAT